ncbi:MAG: NAD(P)/FAD-dependent oxidoreductase, partial [Anaerolineae bacterium]
MTHYTYLIVGGGMTADSAARAIRATDPDGSIGIISAETSPPYDRPPLTKGLWKGEELATIWRATDDLDVTLHLGRSVQVLDRDRRRVSDDHDDIYTYDRLLLATGGRPRTLPFDDGRDGIIYYRTVEDYRRLAALAKERRRFAVIGGGFIGSELAASLAMHDRDVVMIFPEAGIGGRMFPADLAQFLNGYYRDQEVQVLSGRQVTAVESHGGSFVLKTADEQAVAADVVVAGLGIIPNTELAEAAGLKTDDGIIVDHFLRTSDPHIYAAGDVAVFPDYLLEKRRRVEHEDNANVMGEVAGRAMAGDPVPYDYSPYFYSDLFDLGYEAVGELNSRMDMVSDWQEPYRKGVVYYLEG